MRDWNISGRALCVWSLGLSVIWAVALWFTIQPQQGAVYVVWLSLCLLGAVALSAAVVDWQSNILPNVITLYIGIPAILLAAGAVGYEEYTLGVQANSWLLTLGGAVLGFGLMKGLQWVLRRQNKGREQMGDGDAKLMLVLGALVGPLGLLPALVFACLLLYPLSKMRRDSLLPFGPSLTLAALVVYLSGVEWPM